MPWQFKGSEKRQFIAHSKHDWQLEEIIFLIPILTRKPDLMEIHNYFTRLLIVMNLFDDVNHTNQKYDYKKKNLQ